jgi:solute carrier family 25 carnitine/acylcarnitine transporter 20/29
MQTIRKEGFFALYKGESYRYVGLIDVVSFHPIEGMASPLVGIAGVNSLLFAAFAAGKRIVSPFPDLSIPQIAVAGSIAGVANSILASPGTFTLAYVRHGRGGAQVSYYYS